MMENIKLLSKGISNFRYMIKDNRYYVDKTMFLPTLELTGNFLLLTRPRRFGKSLSYDFWIPIVLLLNKLNETK